MPSYQLIRRLHPELGPVHCRVIDYELRQHFGEPDNEYFYLNDWFTTVGMRLAKGITLDKQKARNIEAMEHAAACGDQELVSKLDLENRIIDWIESNFKSEPFWERKLLV